MYRSKFYDHLPIDAPVTFSPRNTIKHIYAKIEAHQADAQCFTSLSSRTAAFLAQARGPFENGIYNKILIVKV